MEKSKIELLPHNQNIYNRIKKHINEGEHSIFYSEATGLGKSYIFMKLAHEIFTNKRILYIVPKLCTWYNISLYEEFKLISNHVEMTTFADFNYIKDKHYTYDIIFIDEAHHLSSPIQGQNIKIVMKDYIDKNNFVFGMTATPEVKRGKKNIDVSEYFEVSVLGYDIFSAIEKGLFPKMEYAIADLYSIPDDDFDEEEKAVLKKYNVDNNRPVVESILNERKDINHWMAFFSNIEDLEINMGHLERLFPDYKLFCIHCEKKNNSQTIKEFVKYDGKSILLNVSMGLESMHLTNIGGLMLFRNIINWHTLLQILGRICRINNPVSPLILDITNCIYNIRIDFECIFSNTNIRGSRDIRKIIEMGSDTYRYIEFVETAQELLRMRGEAGEYRDFKWYCNRDLANQINKDISFINKRRRDGYSYEDIIDEFLNYRTIYNYRDVYWDNDRMLATRLGISIELLMNLKREKSYKEIIDYYIDLGFKYYKGFIYYSYEDLYKYGYFNFSEDYYNCSLEEIIDNRLDGKYSGDFIYRNIVWKSDEDLSLKLGKHLRYVYNCKKFYHQSYKEIIDKVLDGRLKSYRGFKWSNRKELAILLNKSAAYINQFYLKYRYTDEDVIDWFIDQTIKKYRNISWKNRTQLVKTLSKICKKKSQFINYLLINSDFKSYPWEYIIDELLDTEHL